MAAASGTGGAGGDAVGGDPDGAPPAGGAGTRAPEAEAPSFFAAPDRPEDEVRYPIGRFRPEPRIDAEKRRAYLAEIEALPGALRRAVEGLGGERLETPYRPGGWTVRQVVHHVADSHLNAYVRFKLALTEDRPPVKTWNESAWGELADARDAPLEASLTLIDGLHRRWMGLLASMAREDFARTFRHPEWNEVRLDDFLQLYAWHGRHHVAQIDSLRRRAGWE